MAGSTIISIAYGIEVQDASDPYLATAEHVMEAVNATFTPGAYLVDMLPFCELKRMYLCIFVLTFRVK